MGRDERMSAPDAGGGTLIKALVLRTDGSLPFIKEIPSQNEALAVLKEVITSPHGDWFDCVRGENFHAYVNDTGETDGLPLNPIASSILGENVFGNVIIFGSLTPDGEWDGEEHDVPRPIIERAKQQWLTQQIIDACNVQLEREFARRRITNLLTDADVITILKSYVRASRVSV